MLTIPIQALTVRQRGDLEPPKKKGSVQAAAKTEPKDQGKDKGRDPGRLRHSATERPTFVPVNTGIAGTTDIEVTKGLKEGDEIVTGSYKVLRTLKNGASVKIDNTAPKKEERESSDQPVGLQQG